MLLRQWLISQPFLTFDMYTDRRRTHGPIWTFLSCVVLASSVVTEVILKHRGRESLTDNSALEGREFPWNKIRLPQTIIPVSYKIALRTDLELFQVKGNVTILVDCITATTNIILHLKEMNISKTAVYEKKHAVRRDSPAGVLEGVEEEEKLIERIQEVHRDRELRVIRTMKNKTLEMFLIEVNENLTPGRKYEIHITFEYPLTDKLIGFYRSSYTTKGGEKRLVKEVAGLYASMQEDLIHKSSTL